MKDQNENSGKEFLNSFGQKHLIKCRCVLPQMKKLSKPPPHQFLTFSEVADEVVKVKYAQCNNCGVIHKVIDICSSEIMSGKEAMSSIMTIEDIRSSLNPKLCAILDRHNCDLPTWEHAQYVIENKRWGENVVLTTDVEGDDKVIKYVKIISDGLYRVDLYNRKEILGE